ncbi:ATP-binding protein, partial [Yersinia enterocolitica]|nr:ATP-binding protein [Yersinia enterocolitica]
YEHISPLINKVMASAKTLEKVIEVVEGVNSKQKPLTFISLRNCNQDTKKMIPMMIAKCSFSEHKKNNNGNSSFHLIIDEAHNILSDTSNRESETWKDYRLELFEEIIKEGRKFGFFVTIASQRPADISATIISQLHNYFLHRLVNDNDLFLLKNTISSLDNASRSLIPNLPAGACVISGTAFHTPLIIQIDRLNESDAPQSDTIDLDKLW